jgi:hypothetical protein
VRVNHSYRTSIITIAKEKTSASLLYVPSSVNISGAVHLAVLPDLPRYSTWNPGSE